MARDHELERARDERRPNLVVFLGDEAGLPLTAGPPPPHRVWVLVPAQSLTEVQAALEGGAEYLLVSRARCQELGLVPGSEEHGLSRREREVVELWARGWDLEEIAAEVGSSASTLKTHLKVIYRKTGVRNGRELSWTWAGRPLEPSPSSVEAGASGSEDSVG